MSYVGTINSAFADHEKLIYDISWKFCRRYGGDIEELISEANLVFAKCYGTYDEAEGASFSTYLANCIWYRLLDCLAVTIKRAERFRSNADALRRAAARRPLDRKMQELVEELGNDARTIVRLLIDAPEDLAAMAAWKGGKPRNWRSSLRDYLAKMGWGVDRVREAFSEIQAAL